MLVVDRIGSANAVIKERTKDWLAKVIISILWKAVFLANLVTTIEKINPANSKKNQLCPKVCLKCKTKMLAKMYLDAELKSGEQGMKDHVVLERENAGKG